MYIYTTEAKTNLYALCPGALRFNIDLLYAVTIYHTTVHQNKRGR